MKIREVRAMSKGGLATSGVVGIIAGGVGGFLLGKIGQSDATAMHWKSPTGVVWYAVGFPSQKKFYLVNGNYVWQFMESSMSGVTDTFIKVGAANTLLVPSNYIYGGQITDTGNLTLPT